MICLILYLRFTRERSRFVVDVGHAMSDKMGHVSNKNALALGGVSCTRFVCFVALWYTWKSNRKQKIYKLAGEVGEINLAPVLKPRLEARGAFRKKS